MYRWVGFIVAGLLAFPSIVGCSLLDESNVQQAAEYAQEFLDGTSCEVDAQCLGGRCLTEDEGYPNGYCTTAGCRRSGCTGFRARCFRIEGEVSGTQTACFRKCGSDGDCERAGEGYECVQKRGISICLPPDVTDARPQGSIGAACERNGECNGEESDCLRNFRGGYCSKLDCKGDEDCPGDGVCASLSAQSEEAEARPACLLPCESDDECRRGYGCAELDGTSVCVDSSEVPGLETEPANPEGDDDGEPCESDLECKGERCIVEREESEQGDYTAYPGGYCSTPDCSSDEDCFGEATCVQRARSASCMATCESDGDCRDGYRCRQSESGARYCDTEPAPEPDDEEEDPDVTPDDSRELNVQCQQGNTLSFSVPEGAEGFYFAPYTEEDVQIQPTTMTLPSGETVDIPRDYSFMDVNTRALESYTPLLFPASDRAEFDGMFTGGDYELVMEATGSPELCYYVLPQHDEGVDLEVRVYLVGVPGVTADSARNDEDMQEVVSTVQSVYSDMGVTVEVREYLELGESKTDRFQTIRHVDEIYELLQESSSPGSGLEERLAVNLFMIRDFNVATTPGLLGISAGIPGMIGLHGTKGSGLVFTSADLGNSNESLGLVIAHEVGHFLGLRHTTERRASEFDPITDTPECDQERLSATCPDARNFMFAYSLGDDQTNTTTGQGTVIRTNPVVVPAE